MPPGLELPWRRVRPLLPQAVGRLAAATTAPKPTTPFATFSSRFAPADRLRCVAAVAQPTIKRVRRNHSAADAPPAVLWPAGLAKGEEDGREDEKQKEEKTEADGQQRSNAERKDVAVDIDGPGSGQRIDHQQQEGRQQRRSPGAVLLESLARDPVRRPADDRASSPSALVAPLVHYPHPLETQRSRLRHRKSVVRQARLEAIRQALERPLPDWREILQRLVSYTPYYGGEELSRFRSLSAGAGATSPSLSTASASTPRPLSSPSDPMTIPPLLGFVSPSAAGHRDTVSYILPENSPSVDELLRGTDNSLWAIRNRTGSDLELYRRGPMSSKDWTGSAPVQEDGMHADVAAADDLDSVSQTARPWLLTLSGPEASVNHAVADVLRFAKDAVAVAADSNARWGPARIRAAEDGDQSSRPSSPAAVLGATTAPAPAPAPAPTETSAGFSKQEQTPSAGTEDHEPALAHYTWNLISTSYSSDAIHEGDAVDKRDDVVYRPYTLYHNAHEIPQPAEWTRDSFERYVAALTNSRPALHLAGDLYRQQKGENNKRGEGGEGEENTDADADADHNYRLPDSSHSTERRSGHYPPSHDRTVIELLHRVFNDEATRHALSTSALNRALAFMGQRGEAHRPDVRALFVRMELLGLPMDTTTFNTMLASLVKTQDLRNFGATLLLMHGRGHAPDLDTWLLFLRLFESETVKRHILHAMHARGLLTSSAAVQRVAWEMARHDAERAVLAEMEDDQSEASMVTAGTAAAAAASGLDNNNNNKMTSAARDGGADATFLDRFLARQTARYGDGWLTARTANRILDIFGRYSRFDDCERLLGIMQQQEQQRPQEKNEPHEPHELHEVQPPDVVSFNIVLTHCKVQKALSRAVAVVKRMQRPGTADVTPDFVTYQLLFDLAWQCRLPRVLGVVWHCASAARQTSHWMRKRAGRALAGPESASTKFLVQALRAGDRLFDEPAGWANDEARRTAATTTTTTTTAGQHLGNIVSTRLAARYAGWEPVALLGDLLQEARDQDLAWLQRRKYGDSGDGGDDNGRTQRPRLQPMRIPLRRRTDNAGGPTGDRDDPASNQQLYMNIVVDEMVLRPPPAAVRQTEADDGSGIAAAANE